MAPTIEEATLELDARISEKEKQRNEEDFNSECERNKRKFADLQDTIFTGVEEIYGEACRQQLNNSEEILRETFCKVVNDEILYKEKLKLIAFTISTKKKGWRWEKTCFLGFITDYESFKNRFPYLCKKYSPLENDETFLEMWSFLAREDIGMWTEGRGEIQAVASEDTGEGDEIIVAVEFDKRSKLGKAILKMNEKEQIFEKGEVSYDTTHLNE